MNPNFRFTISVPIGSLLIFVLLAGVAVFVLETSSAYASSSQAAIDCSNSIFLPIVIRVSAALQMFSPDASVSLARFSAALPCLDPGPVTGMLADPDENEALPEPVRPTNGICPSDMHPVFANGWPNFSEEDEEGLLFTDSNFTCEPDQTLADAQCSANGDPVLLGGLAACQCDTGYAGASCNTCAPGYLFDQDTQTCQPEGESPKPNILGVEKSVETGQVARFAATDPQGSPIESTWSLGNPQSVNLESPAVNFEVDGCLFKIGGDQSCQETVTDTQVGYMAPGSLAADSDVNMVQLNINPIGNPQFGLATESIVIVGAGGVPITGHGDARMEPMLNSLSRYMRQRCIGATMLGVSRYGFPLAVYGLGREDGRASASWHDYCGDNEALPLAAPTTNTTPLRVGSANKPITFSVLRYILNEKLKEADTDLDVAAISSERVVTAQRTLDGDAKLIVWNVASDGSLSILDEDIYDPAPVNGIETIIRDISLIALPDGHVILGTRNSAVPRLNAWSVAQDGELAHVATLAIGNLIDLELTPLVNNLVSDNRFVGAVRKVDGSLEVRVYQLVSGNQINLLDDFLIEDANARDLALVDVSESTLSRLIVGNRDGDRRIILRSLDIASNGVLSQVGSAQTSPVGEDLALTALTPNRIVSAVRKVDQEDRLWLVSWSVAVNGTLQLLQGKLGDPIQDLAISALGGARVIVADRLTSNGNLQMSTYDVAGDGSFTFLDGDGGGNLSGHALAALTPQRAILTLRNASNNLENIVWSADAGGVLSRLDEAVDDKVSDSTWSEEDIENLNLVGFDLPELLLPDRLHAILRGDIEPPVYIPLDDCDDLTDFADTQWQQVKIGNLLRHSTGLPKSAPGLTTQIENLHLLRELNSLPDFAAQEQLLKAEFGNATVDAGKATLGYGGETVFVVPEPTLEEIFILVAGRCLPNSLGTSVYSNSSASLAGLVIEHLAGRFAANVGYPASHQGSALDLFFDFQLGIQTSGDAGAFYSQRVFGLPGYSFPDPAYRIWSSSDTYYPTLYDNKRPHCIWNGSTCSFSDWLNGNHGTIRWLWDSNQTVPFELEASGTANGSAGNLSIEPGVFLSFLRQYWLNNVSGETNPSIGEKRENIWDSFRTHNGSADGTKARIFQLGTTDNTLALDFKLPRKYNLPYIPITGDDVFGETETAFFNARADTGNVQTGHIYTTLSSGQAVDLTEVEFQSGDLLAVGTNKYQNKPDSFYIARHDTGLIEIFKPSSAEKISFPGDFSAGDGFAVDDIVQTTVNDEVILGDANTGEVRIYPTPALVINGDAIPLVTHNLSFAAGDKLAVGDANGNGTNELYIARAATGNIDIYGADGVFWMQFDADYTSSDGFAVGDVVGTQTDRDEIIIGRAQNNLIEVYAYSGGDIDAYQHYTTFNGLFQSTGDLAVNDLGYGSHLNEIIVGVPAYGLAVVFKAQNVSGSYQFVLQDYQALNVPFAQGDQVAAGFWRGLHRYRCSYGSYGTRQSDFPDGVDIVLALNTSSDQQCSDSDSCGAYFGEMRDNTLLHGVCEIDWSNVIP